MYDIVEFVCLQGDLLKTYAALHRINPANASGRPFREVLQGHYDEIDPKPAEKQHHTIGPQVDPQQLEPSAPMAARQWAAD